MPPRLDPTPLPGGPWLLWPAPRASGDLPLGSRVPPPPRTRPPACRTFARGRGVRPETTRRYSVKRLAALAAMALLGATVFTVLSAGPASAHVVKRVGSYIMTVGFGAEPVYVGQQNSVQLILEHSDGKPVTNLTDSLKVEVIYQDRKTQLPLEPTFDPDTGLGTPGDYRAWFFPTAPGKFTFHFFGSIDGQQIDQS